MVAKVKANSTAEEKVYPEVVIYPDSWLLDPNALHDFCELLAIHKQNLDSKSGADELIPRLEAQAQTYFDFSLLSDKDSTAFVRELGKTETSSDEDGYMITSAAITLGSVISPPQEEQDSALSQPSAKEPAAPTQAKASTTRAHALLTQQQAPSQSDIALAKLTRSAYSHIRRFQAHETHDERKLLALEVLLSSLHHTRGQHPEARLAAVQNIMGSPAGSLLENIDNVDQAITTFVSLFRLDESQQLLLAVREQIAERVIPLEKALEEARVKHGNRSFPPCPSQELKELSSALATLRCRLSTSDEKLAKLMDQAVKLYSYATLDSISHCEKVGDGLKVRKSILNNILDVLSDSSKTPAARARSAGRLYNENRKVLTQHRNIFKRFLILICEAFYKAMNYKNSPTESQARDYALRKVRVPKGVKPLESTLHTIQEGSASGTEGEDAASPADEGQTPPCSSLELGTPGY